MLRNLLNKHSVSTTAFLSNFWKDTAKGAKNWDDLTCKRGERQQDLFKDKFMSLFIDEEVEREANIRLDKMMWLPLATRARFFRRAISKHVKCNGVEQVILLGAGFDTLAFRKNKYTAKYGVHFFEVDQASILNCKKDILTANGVDKNAEYILMDYVAGDLLAALEERKVDFTKPTMILWEGNVFYLDKVDVMNVLKKLAGKFEKLVIGLDFMHEAMNNQARELDAAENKTSMLQTLDAFAKKNSPFKSFFEPDEMKDMCNQLGLRSMTMSTAAELAMQYGVDNGPYYTAKPYSVATFSNFIK